MSTKHTLATAAILIAAVAAPTAQSTIRESGTYVDEEYAYDIPCSDELHLDVAGVAEGRWRLRDGKGDSDRTFLLLDKATYTETITNRATGAFFTVVIAGTFNEVKSRHLEGDLFLFRAHQSGKTLTVYDSDGVERYRDRGSVKFSFVFDAGPDDEPGGVHVEDFDFSLAGQHPIGERDVCDVAAELIG